MSAPTPSASRTRRSSWSPSVSPPPPTSPDPSSPRGLRRAAPPKLRRAALRGVDFGEDGRHETRVYDRDLLPPGFEADGPVIVEEPSSTTLVCPGQRVRVDDLGFLRITEA